tara:strand:- start:711 stop:1094 length:384 start_codon:yes stop_codon:yes gene_type:complete
MFKVKNLFIYCLWILVLTITYYFDITKYSLLYSAVGALIFSLTYNIIIKRNLGELLAIVTIEFLLILINIKKHFFIDKKKLISMRDIKFNIILFIIYNIFLLALGTNFYEYYLSLDPRDKSNFLFTF